jgi:hypothetical protein
MNNITKTLFKIFSKNKSDKISGTQSTSSQLQISHEELRDFLINNNLKGELLKSVTDLRSIYTDLSNYQAVEFLLDFKELKS